MILPLHLRSLPPRWQWVETCVLSVLVLGLSHWLVFDDPYLTHQAFPWIWLVAVLVALRYGMWAGLLSVGVLLGAFLLESRLGVLVESAMAKSYVIGGVLLIVICGEFGSRWSMHLKQVEERNDYLDQRLQETTRAYHLLGMSHHHLEEYIVSQPLTLRDALKRLRGMLLERADEIPVEAAERFLQLLTQFFQLEVAAVFPSMKHSVEASPLATVGSPGPLLLDDSLVHHARTTNEFSHVMMRGSVSVTGTQYLIVAPAKASNGMIVGWFVVEQMRFLSLHEESLHMLRVFLNYFADGFQAATLAAPILAEFPDCPVAFARELPRLVRLQSELGLQSRVAVFHVAQQTLREEMVFHIIHHTRGLDVTWDMHRDEERRLCVLLPFSDDAAVEGYLERIQGLIKERFGMGFDEAEIFVNVRGLSEDSSITLVRELVLGSHDTKAVPVLSGVA